MSIIYFDEKRRVKLLGMVKNYSGNFAYVLITNRYFQAYAKSLDPKFNLLKTQYISNDNMDYIDPIMESFINEIFANMFAANTSAYNKANNCMFYAPKLSYKQCPNIDCDFFQLGNELLALLENIDSSAIDEKWLQPYKRICKPFREYKD